MDPEEIQIQIAVQVDLMEIQSHHIGESLGVPAVTVQVAVDIVAAVVGTEAVAEAVAAEVPLRLRLDSRLY